MVSNAWSSERVQHDGHDGADRRLAGDGLDRCRDEMPMVRRGRCARRVSSRSGRQCVEERNPWYEGNIDTPIRQYVWGQYVDECVQLATLVVLVS